jgi:hypothetical protein
MKGLLADMNDVRQVRVLVMILQEEPRLEFWNHLRLSTPTFADLEVWQKCQEEELVLITANRNADSPDSLKTTIRTHGTVASLPVFTLADANRGLTERTYAELVDERLLEYLFDIENLRGAGRMYLP